MNRPRVAILISGSGSNMATLIDAMRDRAIAADPVLVLSNNPAAPGLARAEARGVATGAVDHRRFGRDRAAFDAAFGAALEVARPDIVCCAGYMRIMTDGLVEAWAGRMLNIHPSLLPLFKGLDTHARALAAGVAVHGCTVHEVVPELDSGRILGQAVVPVLAGDTPETLAARVLPMEHRLYKACLARFIAGETAPLALLA